MTIGRSFIQLLEDKGFGVFGETLFYMRVPNSKEVPDEIYWVIPNGGSPISKNKTGEIVKLYSFLVYYRSTKAQDVDETLFELEELLNCLDCVELEGFQLNDIQVNSFPTDVDLDDENREMGLIQVNLQTYKQRC